MVLNQGSIVVSKSQGYHKDGVSLCTWSRMSFNNIRCCYWAVNSLSMSPRLPCFARLEWSLSSFLFGGWPHGAGGEVPFSIRSRLSVHLESRVLYAWGLQSPDSSCCPAHQPYPRSHQANQPTSPPLLGHRHILPTALKLCFGERTCLHSCSFLWDPLGPGVFFRVPFPSSSSWQAGSLHQLC